MFALIIFKIKRAMKESLGNRNFIDNYLVFWGKF